MLLEEFLLCGDDVVGQRAKECGFGGVAVGGELAGLEVCEL